MGWNQYQTEMNKPSVKSLETKIKLNIVDSTFTVERQGKVNKRMIRDYNKKFNKNELMNVAQKLYPDLFAKYGDALPIKIDVKVKIEQNILYPLLSALTLCSILPQCTDSNHQSKLSLYLEEEIYRSGQYVNEIEYDFKTREVTSSFFLPTAFLVPSLSNGSKNSWFLDEDMEHIESQKEDIIHATVQAVLDDNHYENLAKLNEQRLINIKQNGSDLAEKSILKSDKPIDDKTATLIISS